MVSIKGITIFRVGEPILVENTSTVGFDEYVLTTQSENQDPLVIDSQFLPNEGLTYSYGSEGVRQLKLKASITVPGFTHTSEQSITFDVGYAPNFSLEFQKRIDQSNVYTENYAALGVTFDVEIVYDPKPTLPTTYVWNYGEAITGPINDYLIQNLKYSSLGTKTLGLTISNRFGIQNDEIQIKSIDTPNFGIIVNPDNGQFKTNEEIKISRQFIAGNGHVSSDINTYFVIQGTEYNLNSVSLTFGQTGIAGITLYFQSKILTGLSGSTYKEYQIVEDLNPYVIYVSGISGNDSWSGEYPYITGSSGPVKTLTKASELASEYTGVRNVEVQIQQGTYRFLEQSFYLNSSDSGIEKTITYKPYLSSQVIISGGYTVSPSLFTLVTAGNTLIYNRLKSSAQGNVYGADLSSVGISFGITLPNNWNGEGIAGERKLPSIPELYFNSDKMTVSRWPNKTTSVNDSGNPYDYDFNAHITSNYRQGKITNPSGTRLNAIFGYEAGYTSTIDRWSVTGPNPQEGIWLHGFWQYDWSDEVMKVVSIDKTNRRIEVDSLNAGRQPVQYFCGATPVNPTGPTGNGLAFSPWENVSNPTLRRWFAFNILEELDSQGEYYLDRYNKKLYFWPPAAITAGSEIILSSIRLSGDNSWVPGTPTQWSQNRNLHYTVPENTRDANASLFKFFRLKNVIVDGLIFRESCGSMVEMNMCENITIKNCKIYSPRKNGIVIMAGKNNTIDNCEFYYCGLHSVVLTGGNRQTLIPANNILKNSKIIGSGRFTPSRSTAVRLVGVGNIVQKNIIAECPGSAIVFYGNDHIIEYNNFTNVSMGQDDHGGVYSGGNISDRGTIIRYNFFNNVRSLLPGGALTMRVPLVDECMDCYDTCAGYTCYSDVHRISTGIYIDQFNSGTVIDSNVFYMTGSTQSNLHGAIFCNMGVDNNVKNNIFVDVPSAFGTRSGTREAWQLYEEGLTSGPQNVAQYGLQQIINIDNDPWYENGGPENLVSYDYSPYSFFGCWYGIFGTFRGTKGLMNKVNITGTTWASKYPSLGGPDGMIRYDPSTFMITLNPSYSMKNYISNNVVVNQLKRGYPFRLFRGASGTPVSCGSSELYMNSFDLGPNLTGGTALYSIFEDKSSLNFKLTSSGLSFIKTSLPNFIDIPFEKIPVYP